MKNKEVLRLIYDLDTGNPSTYKIEQNKIKIVKDYIEQLEKENAELKKQLQAKDKALEKACGKIAQIVSMNDECIEQWCNRKICNALCNNDCNNALKWKEWCEK